MGVLASTSIRQRPNRGAGVSSHPLHTFTPATIIRFLRITTTLPWRSLSPFPSLTMVSTRSAGTKRTISQAFQPAKALNASQAATKKTGAATATTAPAAAASPSPTKKARTAKKEEEVSHSMEGPHLMCRKPLQISLLDQVVKQIL